ncbi:hypothetical protein BDY19DRAFT_879427 [Irpex rosettiformis]|uniref:Uncharacterized protein n=1 Tax=Irpex rosettiformis TaxID=378272 RepID=A0ACB8UMP4_9APHY|nr:hypothetical protein BDY19DRAFT_879427 [Irpex rosettiformis]
MFPPMHLLALSGKSLEDLEHNSQIRRWYQNRNTILGFLVSLVLSVTGSSALTTFYSLHGLIDILQIFALILNTIAPKGNIDPGYAWKKLIFGTIPNILAFNLATSIRVALIMLVVLMIIAGLLLYLFYRATSTCCRFGKPEGFQQPPLLTNQWCLVITSFLLTAIYLPLSTVAVHVIVWSDDLWVVPNPYVNATTFPPQLPPLGPATEFRGPLDFCYTTTMKRNQLNYAPIVLIVALISFFGLGVWYPVHLRRTIQLVAPRVDAYTELGILRNNTELNREYQRALYRDKNPLQFLYNDYRRGWATYEAIYLFAKLAALLMVAVIDPDNCLFRSLDRVHVQTTRQIMLLATMVCFFLGQWFMAPFLNPIDNASEFVSRLNYVLTAVITLLVALDIPGKDVWNGPLLYIVYVMTYGLGFYFTVVGWSVSQRAIKRLARRIDFSIDVFSPRIDLTPSSQHIKRRIWQEAISTLFLTEPECSIPKTQLMLFALARDTTVNYPPYLLNFEGSPAERHVENLKAIGNVGYMKGVALVYGSNATWFQFLQETIQRHYVGPDCYWKDPSRNEVPGCRRFFGNAWYIPFPPTVAIRYDDGPLAVISEIADLELYVRQNSSHDIRRRREVRLALRALDGQVVHWPYEHVEFVGSRSPLCCCFPGRRYEAQTSLHYRYAIFRLKRRGLLNWENINFGSGFDVELTYARRVVVTGSVVGLTDDFDLTTQLARFLSLNEELIVEPIEHLEYAIQRYRDSAIYESEKKRDALSYRFLATVYDSPREPTGLAESSIRYEKDLRVRRLLSSSEDIFQITYERLCVAGRSEITAWWYIFWDDLWRRNHDTISSFELYAADFDPHYPTSIAYSPLPRAALESFLAQRGLYHSKTKWGDFFHSGLLNKMYMRMFDILYHGTRHGDIIHFGEGNSAEYDMEEIDAQTQMRPSTLGTGGGTDHDDSSIRARPLYRWEGILEDPLVKHERHTPNFFAKLGVWFGITPRWRSGIPSMGLALDVQLDSGRYILVHEEEDADDASDASLSKS